MKQPAKSEPIIILPPPQIVIGPLSNKFKIDFSVIWGEFEQSFSVSREEGNPTYKMVELINRALLEGSESKPYIVK